MGGNHLGPVVARGGRRILILPLRRGSSHDARLSGAYQQRGQGAYDTQLVIRHCHIGQIHVPGVCDDIEPLDRVTDENLRTRGISRILGVGVFQDRQVRIRFLLAIVVRDVRVCVRSPSIVADRSRGVRLQPK